MYLFGMENHKHIYTKILEVNLFAFAYRLFHEDFSFLPVIIHVIHVETSLLYHHVLITSFLVV